MAVLTPTSLIVAQRLLVWDRARVDGLLANGVDASLYRQRQNQAAARIDNDVDTWPRLMVEGFLAVLEVFRTATTTMQYGVGPLQHPVPRLNKAERTALKAFAAEIGVLSNLREVSPVQWADDDGEED